MLWRQWRGGPGAKRLANLISLQLHIHETIKWACTLRNVATRFDSTSLCSVLLLTLIRSHRAIYFDPSCSAPSMAPSLMHVCHVWCNDMQHAHNLRPLSCNPISDHWGQWPCSLINFFNHGERAWFEAQRERTWFGNDETLCFCLRFLHKKLYF